MVTINLAKLKILIIILSSILYLSGWKYYFVVIWKRQYVNAPWICNILNLSSFILTSLAIFACLVLSHQKCIPFFSFVPQSSPLFFSNQGSLLPTFYQQLFCITFLCSFYVLTFCVFNFLAKVNQCKSCL